jgi:Sortase domain
MTSQPSPAYSGHYLRRKRHPYRGWVAAAIVLLLVGAWFLVSGLRSHTVEIQAGEAPAVAARSLPTTLRIPAIGVSVSLSSLGLNTDGTVQVPTNYQQPGWYKLGPSPGQMGSSVILGHVDDFKGPAVFFKLGSLRVGSDVEVTLADGVVADFVVKAVKTYLKVQFPAKKVYVSQGFSALQLVTCGGKFDSKTGHYLSNVVAYTSLVSITTPPPLEALWSQ